MAQSPTEYTRSDFYAALDENSRVVLTETEDYVAQHYPEYRPFDYKPVDKTKTEWSFAYRKRPKTGKALCAAYASGGKLALRFSMLSSMVHEFLLRQDEFTRKTQKTALGQMVCAVNHNCRSYGGNTPCEFRQHYWINHRIIRACPYPWVRFDDVGTDDLPDIKRVIDMQMKHMKQDPRDGKGAGYAEGTAARCGEVQVCPLENITLEMNAYMEKDYLKTHVKNPSRLEKYAGLYRLVFIGEGDGLWFFDSDESIRGMNGGKEGYTRHGTDNEKNGRAPHGMNNEKNGYTPAEVPPGMYAAVIVANPLTFSFTRARNYIFKWTRDNNKSIREVKPANGENTVCFARFYMKDGQEFMKVYIPVE
jgi:hypothetical protein